MSIVPIKVSVVSKSHTHTHKGIDMSKSLEQRLAEVPEMSLVSLARTYSTAAGKVKLTVLIRHFDLPVNAQTKDYFKKFLKKHNMRWVTHKKKRGRIYMSFEQDSVDNTDDVTIDKTKLRHLSSVIAEKNMHDNALNWLLSFDDKSSMRGKQSYHRYLRTASKDIKIEYIDEVLEEKNSHLFEHNLMLHLLEKV